LKEGDLVMADASEDYEGIGKSVEILNIKNLKIISGLHTYLIREKDSTFVPMFKGFLYSNVMIKKQFDKLATGLKVYGVSKSNLKTVFVPFPQDKKEQQSIIEVLLDTDKLMNKIIKLIKKKRTMRDTILEQLLSGKRRLKGFSEDWEKVVMGNIAKEIANRINWRGLSTRDYRVSGPIMLTVGNVRNTGIDFSIPYKHITREKYEGSPEIMIKKGDILLTKSGTIGRCCLVEKDYGEMTLNSAIIILRMKESIDSKFFTYLLQSSKGQEQIHIL
jgi:type I restriction enzyme S subunit